ncbi:hypothetical protein [Sutterella sp.]|uniref:hypothetical protein n=1 Tax=Sutterella sp. TaxID=1981025 RepID=UPI003FD7AF09
MTTGRASERGVNFNRTIHFTIMQSTRTNAVLTAYWWWRLSKERVLRPRAR